MTIKFLILFPELSFFYLLSSLLSLFSLLTRIKAMTVLVSPNGVSSERQFEISVSDKKRIWINIIGTNILYKTRQQWQRQVHQTKGFISNTMAVMYYNSWYISLSSSRGMTEFCVVWRTWTPTLNFLNFYFKSIAVSKIQFLDSFDSEKKVNDVRVSRYAWGKYHIIF